MTKPAPSSNKHPAGTPASSAKNIWLALLVSVWLLATLAGLWWFQQQNVRPFVSNNDDTRFWQASQVGQMLQPLLQQLPPSAIPEGTDEPVLLLHFWNPVCLCNQTSSVSAILMA